MLRVSADYTKISKKWPEKKTHWAREGCQKWSFFRDFDREAPVFFRIFLGVFGIFLVFFCRFSACIACILTCLVHSVYNMAKQACIMHDTYVYRYQKGVYPHIQCVMRVCRAFLSCSVVPKTCILSCSVCFFFVSFAVRMQDPRLSEKQNKKKSALRMMPQSTHVHTLKVVFVIIL